jgi:hypothetical protein
MRVLSEGPIVRARTAQPAESELSLERDVVVTIDAILRIAQIEQFVSIELIVGIVTFVTDPRIVNGFPIDTTGRILEFVKTRIGGIIVGIVTTVCGVPE